MATTQKAVATAPAVNLEEQLASLLSTKAVSSGSKSLAQVFEQIAREHNHVVTFEQAKAASPKSPSDLAYYFRQAGGKVMTTKGRGSQTSWTVQKLSNGQLGYPDAVKAEVDRLKAELAKAKS
jgi:hypothetical protein